jgi:hypothetical protein
VKINFEETEAMTTEAREEKVENKIIKFKDSRALSPRQSSRQKGVPKEFEVKIDAVAPLNKEALKAIILNAIRESSAELDQFYYESLESADNISIEIIDETSDDGVLMVYFHTTASEKFCDARGEFLDMSEVKQIMLSKKARTPLNISPILKDRDFSRWSALADTVGHLLSESMASITNLNLATTPHPESINKVDVSFIQPHQ